MLETKLILTPFTTLGEIREFVEMAKNADPNQVVIRYVEHHDMIDALAILHGYESS